MVPFLRIKKELIRERQNASSIRAVTPVQSWMSLKNRSTSKMSFSSVACLIEASEEAEGDAVWNRLKTHARIFDYSHYGSEKAPRAN